MRIIPVLDLMNGQVVQAVRGERDTYQPIKSILTPETNPLAVAQALQAETGCREFYIADLDALQGKGDHWDVIRQLAAEVKADLWIDAGVTHAASALKALNTGSIHVIVCSETLQDPEFLIDLGDGFPSERLLFSIDIVSGSVLARSSVLQDLDPLDAIDFLSRRGWSRFILLTLDRVGTGAGFDWSLLQAARRRFPELSLIAGGGARKPHDIIALAALDLSGALVATAFHRGWITRHDLAIMHLNR
jgi:phosphoribosylformimino-5-aminoimidazole carboxamide ribotide isomerase